MKVPHKKKDRTECGNDRGNSLMAHAGEVLFKVIGGHLSDYRELETNLPQEQWGGRTHRSTVDMMFVVLRLQKLARKKGTPLYLCFIDRSKEYDCVDRTFLWHVLACSGVPPNVLSVIRDLHDGMKTCVGSDDGECS